MEPRRHEITNPFAAALRACKYLVQCVVEETCIPDGFVASGSHPGEYERKVATKFAPTITWRVRAEDDVCWISAWDGDVLLARARFRRYRELERTWIPGRPEPDLPEPERPEVHVSPELDARCGRSTQRSAYHRALRAHFLEFKGFRYLTPLMRKKMSRFMLANM